MNKRYKALALMLALVMCLLCGCDLFGVAIIETEKEMFTYMYDRIGKIDYEKAASVIDGNGVDFSCSPPLEDRNSSVTVMYDSGFNLYLEFIKDSHGRETLSLITYTNKMYSGTVTDNAHTTALEYSVHDYDSDPQDYDVGALEDLTDFVFSEVPRRREEYKQKIASKDKLDVTFVCGKLIDNNKTYIYVETNLPDETKLHIELYKDDIYVDCVSVIEDGKTFSDGFTDNGEKLTGNFSLNVTMLDGWEQPKSVSDVTGLCGELLAGDYLMWNKRRTTVEYRTIVQL